MKEAKSYCVTNFGNYAEGLGTLRASGGDIGGGQRNAYTGIKPEPRKSREHGSLPLSPRKYGIRGGYVPMIVEVLPFDTTQITSDKNWSHPKYGDPCHPLAAGAAPPRW